MTTATACHGARGAAPPQPRYPGLGTPPHTIHTRPQRPVPAEARGRVRLLKREIAARAALLDPLNKEVRRAARDLVLKSGVGRARASAKLRRLLADAEFLAARLAGREPMMVWSYLDTCGPPYESENPSETQGCVGVKYILAGAGPGDSIGVSSGQWALLVTDHALGRLVQRDPGADPRAVILAGHGNLLRARAGSIDDARFALPAGDGAFMARFVVATDPRGEIVFDVLASTWVHNDQMYGDQRPILGDGVPGPPLGSKWLLPWPLRRIDPASRAVEAIGPALPEGVL